MKKICVNIMESERGWGQRIDEQKLFDSIDDANKFVIEFNKKHCTETSAPDWYMYASEPFITNVD